MSLSKTGKYLNRFVSQVPGMELDTCYIVKYLFFHFTTAKKVLNTSNVSITDCIRLLEYKALILERQVVLPLFAIVFRLYVFLRK